MTQNQEKHSFVWVLTQQQQIKKVDVSGGIQDKSPPNFASAISFSQENTLWIVPADNKENSNRICFSEDEGQHWDVIDLASIQIHRMSASHLGSCFILTPQGSIYLVQKSGEVQQVFGEGIAHDLAVSPEGFIWIISREKKQGGGNLVFWCTYGNFGLQPAYGQPVAKKISAGIEGVARIITIGGEVASLYVNRMGGLETPGGEPFAKDIASGCRSNTIWTISSESSKRKSHNILKFWNSDVDKYMEWHTVAGIEPYVITGGD
jgi:hypothetical protein